MQHYNTGAYEGRGNRGVRGNIKSQGSCFVLTTKYYLGNEIKTNEVGGKCSTYGGEKSAYRVLVGKLMERDRLEE
jgi:hypothetical protein